LVHSETNATLHLVKEGHTFVSFCCRLLLFQWKPTPLLQVQGVAYRVSALVWSRL